MLVLRFLRKLGLVFAVVATSLLVGMPAQAGMVGTAQVVQFGGHSDEMVAQREWIRGQLEAHGVEAAEAASRVASLSDEQVRQLREGFDEAPAGAGAVGLVAFIFVVLVITDLTGYTDVFPFIRPASTR